ncbi:MAG: DNA ligase-associated DEXH box helicase [Phycisphaerales bacterium]|nr:MAG: DNA ligase-associated DEXH box helicase [Phycisphaerales bacterium]
MAKTQTTGRGRSVGGGPRASALSRIVGWFDRQGWTPHAFQERAWRLHALGRSGLILVPTGSGKTYAAYMGALAELADAAQGGSGGRGLGILYISPLRALSRDIEQALRRPIEDLGLPLSVESRTGDSPSSVRARQRASLPSVLVTTPESLCLLLTRQDAGGLFASLRTVIVDEWHELLSSKRGSQVELALARLRRFSPSVRTWGLSATIANASEAAAALVGVGAKAEIVRAPVDRPVRVASLLPEDVGRFPWAGHMGLAMLDAVVGWLDPDQPTLVFTNTRSQAETWFQAILARRPQWAERMALHHGSIDRQERERVERGVKHGGIGIVVCTSSLDLGVDFAPVQRVMQIGSPKGVARLMQRAGRARHRPGEPCEITCVPTNAMELLEIAAVRSAIEHGAVEPRDPVGEPLDVLAQHMVTVALGGGFRPDALYEEVRSAWSYRALSREAFDQALLLVTQGGRCLTAYERFCKVELVDGVYRVTSRRIAQIHRLNVGTITGPSTIELRTVQGRSLGHIEDTFIGRLRPGEHFVFAGKVLQLVGVRDDAALVRKGRRSTTLTPIWSGTRLPISESLSRSVREAFERAQELLRSAGPGEPVCPASASADGELLAFLPVVAAQLRRSVVPAADELLVELWSGPEGARLLMYPFEGRLVHAGMSALLALRLARLQPATFTTTFNDYGFELLCPAGFDYQRHLRPDLLTTENLADDALQSVNSAELAKLRFREIARVAGLVVQGYPGARSRSAARHAQASSGLIYDVLSQFEPDHPLLAQARREVLDNQFEQGRLAQALRRLVRARWRIVRLDRPSPLSLPLMVERLNAQTLSTEDVHQRLARLQAEMQEGR